MIRRGPSHWAQFNAAAKINRNSLGQGGVGADRRGSVLDERKEQLRTTQEPSQAWSIFESLLAYPRGSVGDSTAPASGNAGAGAFCGPRGCRTGSKLLDAAAPDGSQPMR